MSSTQPITVTAVSMVAGPLEAEREWYALRTRTCFERKICNQVRSKSYEAYVPVTRERRQWSDRSKIIELPMFPGYVFVRSVSNTSDRLPILQTAGAYGFVTFNGMVARIPDQQIGDLRRIEEQNSAWTPHAFLQAGQRVRVRGGCLDGLEGILITDRGKKLVISIEPMQRSIAVDIATYELDLVQG